MATSREVWACVSAEDRAGDVDQVKAIAWALDPHYRCVELAAEHARLEAGGSGTYDLSAPLPPRAIVGIGRKRIELATAIRARSGGETRLIHVGRDRGCLDRLDYLITTPAFPPPRSPKVLTLPLTPSDRIRRWRSGAVPSEAGLRASEVLMMLSDQGIRPPWINVFLGDPGPAGRRALASRAEVLAARIDRLARRHSLTPVISGSPRTRPELYRALGDALRRHHHLYRWKADDAFNPFEVMLRAGGYSVVTADSISMISQLVCAGHRTLVFPWDSDLTRLRRAAARRLRLAARPGSKDVGGFCAALFRQRLAAPLDARNDFDTVFPAPDLLDGLFERLRRTLT